jgi:hypothetical protein
LPLQVAILTFKAIKYKNILDKFDYLFLKNYILDATAHNEEFIEQEKKI